MGLIIYKPEGVCDNTYRKIVLATAKKLKNSIFSSVVIKNKRNIYFYQGLAKGDIFNGLTGIYSVGKNDKAFFSIINNYKEEKSPWKTEYSTLLTMDISYDEGVYFDRKGPYFILLGTFPYIIHLNKSQPLKNNVVDYIEKNYGYENHPNAFYLFNSAQFDRLAENSPNLNSIEGVVFGDEEEQWIKNENKYYDIEGVKLSDTVWGHIIEKEVSNKIAKKKTLERTAYTRRYFYYKARVYNYVEKFIFIPKHTIGFRSSRQSEMFVVKSVNPENTMIVLKSLINGRERKLYFYELFDKYTTYEIKDLHNGKS